MLVRPGDFLQEELRVDHLKLIVPKARARTIPKSLSRIITGFDVPHLLPVKRRVLT